MILEIYFVLLIWSFVSSTIFLFFKKTEAIKAIYLCLNFIPMILISGMRSSQVGTDTGANHYLFSVLQEVQLRFSIFTDNNIEMGYAFLNKFVGMFSIDSQLFIFVISFITLTGYAYFFFKCSSNVWLSTFLFIGMFFFCETLNTMRQCIASMILCYAYLYLIKSKKVVYMLLVLCATSIHFSAIVFLFFVLFVPINKIKFYLLAFWMIGTFIVINSILHWGGLDLLLQFDFSGKYGGGYADTQYMLPKEFGVGIYRAIVFIGVVLTCLYFDYKERYSEFEKKNVYLLSIFLLCASIATLMQYQILIFYRYIFYFAIYACLLIPLMIKKMKLLKYPAYFALITGVIMLLNRMLVNRVDTEALSYFLFF